MKNRRVKHILLILCLIGCTQPKNLNVEKSNTEVDYILDMVFNNPGEKPINSKFNNPEYLKEMGYNAIVPHLYVNCSITYDNFEKDIIPQNSEERLWIENQAKIIDQKMQAYDSAGIDVYPFTDIFVAPKTLWDKYGSKMGQSVGNLNAYGGEINNVRTPNIQNDLIEELVRAQIEGIFSRFPSIDGLVIRFGETYLHDTPFHMGGSPLRQGDEGIKDHVKLLNIFREEICVKRNKKLFYRTWDFGWFHTNPNVYLSITNQIEPHENLIFSIKHTKGDFHRNFPFNPTLGIGKHQQIVEIQCQREYEGKGAHPNYISEAVINGFEEYEGSVGYKSLNDLKKNPNFKGIWTWSRGGGWKGPYVTNELWAELNAYILSKWAQNPEAKEEQLFHSFAKKLSLSDKDAAAFRKIVLLSNRGVLLGRSSKLTHINPWWIRDEFMGGLTSLDFNKQTDEGWGKINNDFYSIVEKGIVDDILAEKIEAVEIWKEIEKLGSGVSTGNNDFKDFLRVSSTYGRIKYDIINQAWIIMLKGLEGDKMGAYDKPAILTAYYNYKQLWEEFRNLKEKNMQCASIYLPYGFSNLYENLHNDEGMEKAINMVYNKIYDNPLINMK